MKTILLTLSLALSLSAVTLHAQPLYSAATTPDVAAVNPSSIAQAAIFDKIMEHMRVPESMKSNVSSERVRVVFTIDENGKAHVLDVNTGRPELKASVTSQFEAIDFTGATAIHQEFSIWLNFKVM